MKGGKRHQGDQWLVATLQTAPVGEQVAGIKAGSSYWDTSEESGWSLGKLMAKLAARTRTESRATAFCLVRADWSRSAGPRFCILPLSVSPPVRK